VIQAAIFDQRASRQDAFDIQPRLDRTFVRQRLLVMPGRLSCYEAPRR
jgi:hypothetical protein